MSSERILLGVTGGVAAFKAVLLLRLLQKRGYSVRCVLTGNALRFVGLPTWQALLGEPPFVEGWDLERTRGGELHVDLSAWADALIVYPATSNFLGSVAAGLADDLLKLTFTSFDGPRLVCPAMHTRMAAQRLHQRALDALRDAGVTVLEPVVGELASGEVGRGRLPEPEQALDALRAALTEQCLAGKRLVVSAGPTREHLDPVRYLSNPSTGRMGFAVAAAAARRGADVTLVAGPVSLATPAGVRRVDVVSAEELAQAVFAASEGADAVVMTAAVADYRPVVRARHKLKKGEGGESVPLERTTDVLAELNRRGLGGVRVGFAMETEDLIVNATAKLQRKGLAFVVANSLMTPGAGFGGSTNVVTFVGPDGSEELPLMSKDAVADRICERLAGLL